MIRRFLQRLFGARSAPSLTVVGERSPSSKRRSRPVPLFGRNRCAWRAEGQKNASFSRFHCETCGVEAFSRDGKPPRQCKRGVDGGL